jgi:pimeloyl-ACP methyl ester carboxylesterase
VWGLADPAFRPGQLARWKEVLPEARVIELARAGHWPHEEEPGRVVEAVSAFLSGGGQTA